MSQWCTIESDPGVFTELITKVGVKNTCVEEIYSLDDAQLLKMISPVYGLIFLFKWNKDPEPRETLDYYDQDLFFANQVINDACASQAILSILLNCPELTIGDDLTNFKEFTKELDPQLKGLSIGEFEALRTVHNSFAKPEPFVITNDKKPKKEGEAFHFISYVPFKGKLYELDGLQKGPILLGDCTKENWLEVAKEEINKRIMKYATSEIRFNLLAVCENKTDKYQQECERFEVQQGLLYKKYKELGGILDETTAKYADECIQKAANAQGIEFEIPDTVDKINDQLGDISTKYQESKFLLGEQKEKFKQYDEENVRRRHNYLPLILELLKYTVKKNKLGELVEKAKEKQKQAEQSKKKDEK